MPADYINKLARMFQDIKVSNDLNQDFKTEYKNKGDIAGKASQLLTTNPLFCVSLFSDVKESLNKMEFFNFNVVFSFFM